MEKEISNPKLLTELNILVQKRNELQESLKHFRNKVTSNSKLGLKQKLLLCQCTKQMNSVKNNLVNNLIIIFIHTFIIYV